MAAGTAPPPSLHRTVRDGPGPTLVLVHGFTQTSASWGPTIPALDRALRSLDVAAPRIIAVDAPGHGASGVVRADLETGARLLAAAVEADAPGAIAIGYSMGARLLLRLLLDRSSALAGAVLLGGTAGIDDPEGRRARRDADHALADDLERDGVAAFLDRWLAQPLFAGLPTDEADLAARRTNTADGLAASLRLAGTGTMDPPWWSDLRLVEVPVLVTWGERDAKFAALGRRLAGALHDAQTAEIADAGHAAHLERPEAFAAAVARFVVERIRPGSTDRS